MISANGKSIIIAANKTVVPLFLLMFFGLYFDSSMFAKKYPETQNIANILMVISFSILFWKSSAKIRELMIYAVIVGIIGEYLFSLGMSMYTYRLENVPFYIPPGHAIVYITTIYFCKQKSIKVNRLLLEKIFTIAIVLYGLVFLITKGDVFGFVMTLTVLLLLKNKPRERLFFLSMYIVVAFLEIVGTTYECWYWPTTAWDVIPFLESGNPPSGISLFYFLLDLSCLWLYKQRHRKAWARMKHIRFLNEKL